MDRFKITDAAIKQAIEYIKTEKGKPPRWVSKYKDDISLKGNKLYYKEREVISKERVDDVLRTELYKKNGDIPAGRDSAFHICKQRYVGISRRALMEFIRKQKPLGEVKSALNKPKVAGGERLKNYVFETDLIFLKKNDLETANKKFEKDDIDDLTYFLSTVEKVTGLCRFEYVTSKLASVVTPKVIKQCEEMAKKLKTTISKCDIRMDRGGEFKITELAKHFKKAEHVNSGVAVENKNAQFQKCFFQVLRQRKATTIRDAMQQSEKLLNNTYNRIHHKTSNELVERADEKENILEYNRKRKTFQAGDKRAPFVVGQHVRILVKSKKPGIDYKRYKNKTYSKQVYVIEKTTKKSIPVKYRVNKTWMLQSDLLKSAPRDKQSVELVEERDKEFKKKQKKEHREHIQKREEEIKEPKPGLRRTKRRGAKTTKLVMLGKKSRPQHIKGIDSDPDTSDDEYEKKLHEESIKKHKEKLQREKAKKKQPPKKSPKHRAYINYLKKKGLPIGGTLADVEARMRRYKQSMKTAKKEPDEKKQPPKQQLSKKERKQKTLISFFKKRGLPFDGSLAVLEARFKQYNQSKKPTIKTV